MRVLFVTLALVVFDQLSKLLVKGFSLPALNISVRGMNYGESIPLLGDWLKITYIENPNMAFGIELGGKLFLTLFAMLAAIVIVVLLYRYRKEKLLFRLSLALVLAGALGNLIDRTLYGVLYGTAPLFHGNVVDFINFDLFVIRIASSAFKFWPIFNVADAAVSIGVVMMLIVGFPIAKAEDASTDEVAELAAEQPSSQPLDRESPTSE